MVKEGDELYAKAFEVSRSNRIGVYQVDVFNQQKEMISTFKGTVYITSRIWE
jgi:acyl-CoA thioesterase